ncbi:MAG: hypothetical protein HKO53_03760, partial [Gemmatimonadetes bacterium]|nr:hypothetical protein [Gemmatimonadota bacterium]
MTAASVSPTEIASVLDALPDYSRYFQADRAHDEESPYRLALGRVAKDWGDQLLDIIEAKPTPLNHAQINLVDALLQGIGEIFRALNANGEIAPETLDARTMRALRRCDGELLTSLEVAQRTAGG